ncbi:hypothetical protein [Enterococcus mundtii]|uniref:hypothetical protein n=1 Tax=Enterococcus mundtii TaxID=53346 RepID=UPI0008248E75|nr:hypothetical protein [Enterococcus mundtii]
MNKIFSSLPQYKQKYLMEHTVLVIKEYPSFGLSKIKYINEDQTFMIDSKLISTAPVKEKTLCIQLLGRWFSDT